MHCNRKDGSHDYDLPEFSSHASVGISVLVVIIWGYKLQFSSRLSLSMFGMSGLLISVYKLSINQSQNH